MFHKLLKLALVPAALLCVGVIRLLARFGFLIRFGEIFSSRIGHMAGNMECYLCEKEAGMQKGFDIWTHRGRVCNKQLAKMLGRAMWIDPTRFLQIISVVNRCFEGWEKHAIETSQLDRDIHGHYGKQKPHLSFTAAEEGKGRDTLRAWGLPEGAKWVCLIVRDSAYLPGLGYHSYRDSDIRTYELAAKELSERGYWVFRMGAKIKRPIDPFLVYPITKVIDYAFDGRRSDFMDLYLGAKCEFCISNGTGFDAIPAIFRRPICFVNYAPLEYLNTWIPNSLAIWKHYEKDGKRMTLEEVYESKAGQFMATPEFLSAGISLVDNTPEEIRDAVIEVADRLNYPVRFMGHAYIPERRQEMFWEKFPRSISPYNNQPLHGEIQLRIGSKFLEQYQ